MSSSDSRKERQTEELRKQGLVMPARDEHGQSINPHIPSYVSNVPWFYENTGPTLKHQRKETHDINPHRDVSRSNIKRQSVSRQTFRPGACQNCGSLSHQTFACHQRTFSKNALSTNRTLVKEEQYVQHNTDNIDFNAKHDRYSGMSDHQAAIFLQRQKAIYLERS